MALLCRKNPNIYKNYTNILLLKDRINLEKNSLVKTKLSEELKDLTLTYEIATGNVSFIAELYNVDFMTGRVMELCIRDLLESTENPSELDIECFHILITKIGAKLESAPRGVAIVDKALVIVERVIDVNLESFCVRVRHLILDIFEKRSQGWPQDTSIQGPNKKKQHLKLSDEFLAEATFVGRFLKEMREVVTRLRDDKLLVFMDRFKMLTLRYEDQIEGTVKMLFERAINMKDKSVIAKVFKGLIGIQATETTRSFSYFLQLLCQDEIRSQIQYAPFFRALSKSVRDLMDRKNDAEGKIFKASLEKDYAMAQRAFEVAKLFGELFKVGFVDKKFLFMYFEVLLNPKFISNTFIECFHHVLNATTSELLEEDSESQFKECFKKLNASIQDIETSLRAQSLIRKSVSLCKTQLNSKSEAAQGSKESSNASLSRPESLSNSTKPQENEVQPNLPRTGFNPFRLPTEFVPSHQLPPPVFNANFNSRQDVVSPNRPPPGFNPPTHSQIEKQVRSLNHL